MNTYTIHHEVGIKASPEAVYQALTDTKKLAGWWTTDTRGNGADVGGVLEFWFGEYCKKFEVIKLQPGKLVRWKSTGKENDDEWDGTEISFSLSVDEKQCNLLFSHSGWLSDTGWLPHCSTKWAVFMLSLKNLLEKGTGRPYPDDVQINYW